MGRRLSTPKHAMIIYALRTYLYDGSPKKSQESQNVVFEYRARADGVEGPRSQRFELIWWHFPLAFSNRFRRYRCCADLTIPHLPDPMYDCHSFGFTSRALPWISSDGPLFEKSGPLLGPTTQCARSSDGGGCSLCVH